MKRIQLALIAGVFVTGAAYGSWAHGDSSKDHTPQRYTFWVAPGVEEDMVDCYYGHMDSYEPSEDGALVTCRPE